MALQSLLTYGPVLEVYQFTTSFGGNVILAPCLQTFCAEVRIACLMGLLSVTNLGEIGNLAHQLEALSSDHNPWVAMLVGALTWLLVRALDFGGRDWPVLLEFWNYLYGRRDARVYYFGYTNSNLTGKYTGLTVWGGDGSTRPGTDGPHAHLSVTCANGFDKRFGTYNYAAALNDTRPWGLVPWLMAYWAARPVDAHARGIHTTNPTSPIDVEAVTVWEDVMDYMLRPGEEIAVSVPFEANYFKASSFGPPGTFGRLQIQATKVGGTHVLLGSAATLDLNKAVPVPEAQGLAWLEKDFSGKKYDKLIIRNTGTRGEPDPKKSYTVSVTIGRQL